MRSLVLVGAVMLSAGSCNTSEPASVPVMPRDCDALADEVATLVVDLAGPAAGRSGGLPLDVLDVDHPDEVDVWELAASVAEGSPDLEARVAAVASAVQDAGCTPGWAYAEVERKTMQRLSEGMERPNEDFDQAEHAALNLVAILAANFAPSPVGHEVPDGFPPEFPVHPDAELGSSEHDDDGSVTATWTIEGGSATDVVEYYEEALEELRFGGWSVSSSSSGQGPGSRHHSFDVEGYGFAGQVSVSATDDPGDVIVIAALVRKS